MESILGKKAYLCYGVGFYKDISLRNILKNKLKKKKDSDDWDDPEIGESEVRKEIDE